MTQADLSKLSSLSSEQLAALSDEQKAIYVMMKPADQAFFAETFSARDLPKALDRKAEIMTFNQAGRKRLEKLRGMIAEGTSSLVVPGAGPAGGVKGEDLLSAAAAAVGIGALSYAVATDNTARWQGVKPRDLVAPLKNEFENQERTDIEFEGSADALEGTVFVASGRRYIPALTINMTRVGNGLEVKMGDLTSRSFLETLRGGGEKVLRLAQKGLILWGRRGRGNPADLISMANSALTDTAGLADVASNLQIKERAWKVIKNSATEFEKAYQDRQAQERAARNALEAAWDRYYACPTCSVSFQEDDKTCRVCGTSRPEAPVRTDPRKM
jgi:hypothetical protein